MGKALCLICSDTTAVLK